MRCVAVGLVGLLGMGCGAAGLRVDVSNQGCPDLHVAAIVDDQVAFAGPVADGALESQERGVPVCRAGTLRIKATVDGRLVGEEREMAFRPDGVLGLHIRCEGTRVSLSVR